MPSYTRGQLRDNVTFVKISNTQEVYYGFNTKDLAAVAGISEGDLSGNLGHLDSVAPNALVIVRATSPKPPRVRLVVNANPDVNQQGSVSTFCAVDKLNLALGAGWQLAKRGNGVSLANNARTIGAVAQLSNGLLVVTPMNKNDFDQYRTELGLQGPTQIQASERDRLVFGASRPKAGQAKKTLDRGTITKPFSTATDVENQGWTVLVTELL